MDWKKDDLDFFKDINIFGKTYLENKINNNSEHFLRLKCRPPVFKIFGYSLKNEFIWLNDMNTISYNFVKKHYKQLFESNISFSLLFSKYVKFNNNEPIIPYLMEILNRQYHVIRFKGKNTEIYALVTFNDIEKLSTLPDFIVSKLKYNIDDGLKYKNSRKLKYRKIQNKYKYI